MPRLADLMTSKDKKAFHLEIEELPSLLKDDEALEALASSWIAGKNWLFCITNKRAFLFCQEITKELIDIPKEKIEHVALNDGITQADIIIKHNNELLIVTMDNKPAKHFYYLLNCLLHNEAIDRNYHASNFANYLKIAIALVLFAIMFSYIDRDSEIVENNKIEEIAENE